MLFRLTALCYQSYLIALDCLSWFRKPTSSVRILLDAESIYDCAPAGSLGSVHCYLRIGRLVPGRHELEVASRLTRRGQGLLFSFILCIPSFALQIQPARRAGGNRAATRRRAVGAGV